MTSFDMRPGTADPVLDTVPVTALDEIADELGAVMAGDVTLPVPTRDGFEVVYSLALDGPRVLAMRRAFKDDSQPTGTDELGWGCAVLANQCAAIVRRGKRLVDSSGQPVTFRSPSLWEMLKIPAGAPSGSTAAVRRFLGSDGVCQATYMALLKAAGYTEEIHPTVPPSTGL